MKNIIRETVAALRRNIPAQTRKKADDMIISTLVAQNAWNEARIICLYDSLPNEVNTKMLIETARKEKKTIVIPNTDNTTPSLQIPDTGNTISKDKVDLFVVPGVAFDRQRNRIGRGGGYYDRLLVGVRAPKIALAYEIQLVAKVPVTKYDIPMDMVITERNIYAK